MKNNGLKGWLYLLPAILFLGVFLVYPLIDVFVYSFEEGYNSASQTFFGVGLYNYSYILHDPYFLQAVKNTFLLVIITVPLSTGIALLISVGLSSIKALRNLFQTIYFLPYVTNTLAVGLVFMILFKKTKLSMIGVSIIGSIFHSLGQIVVAIIILKNSNMIYYLPWLLLFSIPTGLFVGVVSKKMLSELEDKIDF